MNTPFHKIFNGQPCGQSHIPSGATCHVGGAPKMQPGATFTAQHLDQLRKAYGAIEKVDPTGPQFAKLKAFVKGMTPAAKKQVADANIKWVSNLARQQLGMPIQPYKPGAKAVITTDKDIGYRVADIGPGGKEHNVKDVGFTSGMAALHKQHLDTSNDFLAKAQSSLTMATAHRKQAEDYNPGSAEYSYQMEQAKKHAAESEKHATMAKIHSFAAAEYKKKS